MYKSVPSSFTGCTVPQYSTELLLYLAHGAVHSNIFEPLGWVPADPIRPGKVRKHHRSAA